MREGRSLCGPQGISAEPDAGGLLFPVAPSPSVSVCCSGQWKRPCSEQIKVGRCTKGLAEARLRDVDAPTLARGD